MGEYVRTKVITVKPMKELVHPLLTTKYTRVFHEQDFSFNAPHHFRVYTNDGEPASRLVGKVDFQEGPIKEAGVNGVCNEDLIAMVICRLEEFNNSDFRCQQNSMRYHQVRRSFTMA